MMEGHVSWRVNKFLPRQSVRVIIAVVSHDCVAPESKSLCEELRDKLTVKEDLSDLTIATRVVEKQAGSIYWSGTPFDYVDF